VGHDTVAARTGASVPRAVGKVDPLSPEAGHPHPESRGRGARISSVPVPTSGLMSPTSRRILFWGNFGTGNLGNECTLQAIVDSTRRWLPAAEVGCVCPGPSDVRRRHGIDAVPMSQATRTEGGRGLPAWARALRKAGRLPAELLGLVRAVRVLRGTDMLVVAGTGILSDTGEGALGLPYELAKWSIAARLSGAELSLVSVGVEGVAHPLSWIFIKTALTLAQFRSYRDELSRERLTSMGFAAGKDPVFPDLAFSLTARQAPDFSQGDERRPTIAVGLYEYQQSTGVPARAAYSEYLGKMCAFIGWLHQEAYAVRVIIGDLRYDQGVRGDLRAALEARGVPPGTVIDEPAASVEQLIDQLGGVDLVVATRFHTVLLSLVLGKPVISISYDAKNDALMGAMGLDRYCQRIDQLDVGRLTEQFDELKTSIALLRPAILSKASQYREELDEQYRLLFG
jgi:polysaccharide pyruvyl transferase WcaK-like protein